MSTRAAADLAREEFVQLQRDLTVLPSGLYDLAGVTEEDIGWLAEQTVDQQRRRETERVYRSGPGTFKRRRLILFKESVLYDSARLFGPSDARYASV
jgi:hypothetical protein